MKKMLLVAAIVLSAYGMDNDNLNTQEEVEQLDQLARPRHGSWDFRKEDAECCITVFCGVIGGILLKKYLRDHEHQE